MTTFIISAKKNTYAADVKRIPSTRPDSKDLFYSEGDYEYRDSYFGNTAFSGEEVVYHKGKVIWSMNYYGKVYDEINNNDIISFLKQALMSIDAKMPFRGPAEYISEEYIYICENKGDINGFSGVEAIRSKKNNRQVYKLLFHGGKIL